MPHGRAAPQASPWNGGLARAVTACLLAGVLGACRDLGLPDIRADGGVGPDLTVRSPRQGQTVPLNAPVNIDAVSVNGVASVTVTCGGAPSTGACTWNVAPYTGVVDFTRYSLVTTGGVDAGFEQLQLTFLAVDRLGYTSTTSFNECRRRQRRVWQSTSANNAPDLTATNAFPGNARCARALNGTTTVCTSTGFTAP